MRPATIDYVRAESLDQAIDALQQAGDGARPLAGGQMLINQMRARTVRPSTVVDISKLDDLRYARLEGDELAVGALTRMRELDGDSTRSACAALAEAAARIGDPQVRNRATVGGNLFNPDPLSDIAPVLLASGGRVVVQGPGGRREIDAQAFCDAPGGGLAAAEVIVELRFGATGPGAGSAFEKLARRAADAAVASAAAFVRVDNGQLADVRLALGAVHDRPLRAASVESELTGKPFDAEQAKQALVAFAAQLDPPSSPHAESGYRREVAPVIALRALGRAVESAGTR
jgi:carbon-monoxide dehydrogenase medium subunit